MEEALHSAGSFCKDLQQRAERQNPYKRDARLCPYFFTALFLKIRLAEQQNNPCLIAPHVKIRYSTDQ